MKKFLKILSVIILIPLLVVGSYIAYVFIDFHRLPDNQILEVEGQGVAEEVALKDSYRITSWNIGFGAYTADFGFFMDGGTESRGFSKEAVLNNMSNICKHIKTYDSDFLLIQEIDTDSTRAHHIDEKEIIEKKVANGTFHFRDDHGELTGETGVIPLRSYTFANNYDSPYLFYPLTKPHGATQSGLMTLSSYDIQRAKRRSLPIQTGFAKFMDLDRCYSINKIALPEKEFKNKELVLINMHLSAYTTDANIVLEQLKMLYEDIKTEYARGNYVIAGGDFNKDLLGNSGAIFGVSGGDHSWATSFPFETIPKGFDLIAPLDKNKPVPSCRNADGVWNPKTQFQVTIDGFLVSDNVKVKNSYIDDTQFAFSDHNPVVMDFELVH